MTSRTFRILFLSCAWFFHSAVLSPGNEDDDRPRTRSGGINELLMMQVMPAPSTMFLPPGATGGRNQSACPCCGLPYGSGGSGSSTGSKGQGGGTPYTDKYGGGYVSDGTIPEGYSKAQDGVAHIDYDGSSVTVNDPDRQGGNSAGVDGAKVPFVVQNRNAKGGYTYPMGTKVLAVNNDTGQQWWGITGDNGPTNAGRNEISPAMADKLGVNIRDGSGNYVNRTSGDNLSFYYYPDK